MKGFGSFFFRTDIYGQQHASEQSTGSEEVSHSRYLQSILDFPTPATSMNMCLSEHVGKMMININSEILG